MEIFYAICAGYGIGMVLSFFIVVGVFSRWSGISFGRCLKSVFKKEEV
jgi:hypothetical protein